jgi:hypothetical protein
MVLYILTFTFLDSRRDDKRLKIKVDKKVLQIFEEGDARRMLKVRMATAG